MINRRIHRLPATPRRRTLLLATVITGCLSLPGCTVVRFVELREKPRNPIAKRLALKDFSTAKPSADTKDLLTSTGYRGDGRFADLLRHCRQLHTGPRRSDALRASAEISYLSAEATRAKDPALAMELFLDAAQYAWLYLTDEQLTPPDINAPEHRTATELYNTSVEQLLRVARTGGYHKFQNHLQLPVTGRIVRVEIPFPTEWLSREELGPFEFVSDYELRNLRSRHATQGLGVPLVVRRERSNARPDLERYYESRQAIPVTVVAEFKERSDMPNAPHAVLQLLDPRDSDGVVVNNRLLPIETDLSTPLAWSLTDPRKTLLDTLGLIRPDKTKKWQGLYMVTPYDPDRIPVLMVHGLWSSPITWMEMFNDLQADPVIRSRYQFWFYLYPTGEPLTFAAAELRDHLKEVKRRCDPRGENRNLDQMVVVGHSMGGLMSYLMTIDSGDKLWNALSRLPVEQIDGGPRVRHQIRRVFFFEPDRSIDRIVTIASPFNGSGYANRLTQWLGGSLISLPDNMSRLSRMIYHQNNQSIWDRVFAPRTSVDSLNKNSAVIRLVNQTTPPPDVPHHNIVGVCRGSSMSDWTDGVVRLRSASRPTATSELRVKARHSDVHRHPETIQEVTRILHQHLQEIRRRQYPVVPIRHTGRPQTSAGSLATTGP